ncbi:MAG: SOS response-associated peptidase [Variibacter sp.]|nr:SOS response-associated peptidase [Variibacter sp.]
MCGRIIQAAGPLRYAFVDGLDLRSDRLGNLPRRYNGAPGQDLLVIRRNHRTGDVTLEPLRWGLVPHWTTDPKPKLRPINARAETVAGSAMFAEAYARRRCLVPVDGFYEWHATGRGKQPYAIGMADGAPFALGGLWENWKDPASGEWLRTFAVVTVPANELLAHLHPRMPLILHPQDYGRWLGGEDDPADLLRPFPGALMRYWPVSARVNSFREDDGSLPEPIALQAAG